MKELVDKLTLEKGLICEEKKALQMEVEKQTEVQKGFTDKVAEKCDQLEQVKRKMLEERKKMQQEVKSNQEVLQKEVRAKLVMVKENFEKLRKELKKTTSEKKAIEEEKELLVQKIKSVDTPFKDLLNQTSKGVRFLTPLCLSKPFARKDSICGKSNVCQTMTRTTMQRVN